MESVRARKVSGNDVKAQITSKFVGAVFGYLFLGLLITAATCFGFSYFIAARYNNNGTLTQEGFNIVAISAISSLVACYIITFINSIYSMKTGKAPWVGYFLYALLMGVVFSVILLAGIPFELIGEALGITALSMLLMFVIGHFSKINWAPWIMGFALFFLGIFLLGAFWLLIYLIRPAAFVWLDVGISFAICAFCLVIVAFDASRIAKIAARGEGNRNLALFCAFDLYSDFIALFVRILYLLLIFSGRRE